MSKVYLTSGTPNVGDTIEFLKDLLPEDREEFLFGKESEEEAINEFLDALRRSDTYALRLPCGKILAMGGLLADIMPREYTGWLLCARGSERYPKALYRSVKKILNEAEWDGLSAVVYRKSLNHIRFVEKGVGFIPFNNTDDNYIFYSVSRGGQCAI